MKLWAPSVLAVIVLALALVVLERVIEPGKTSKTCTPNKPTPFTGDKVKLDLGEKKFEHAVGRERSGYDVEQLVIGTRDDVALPGNGSSLSGEPVGGFSASKGQGKGLIEDVVVNIRPSGGNTLVVHSCVNTSAVDAGQYVGKILIKGDEIEQFTIPATVTVKRSDFVGWAVIATLAGAIGFFLRALANVGQLVEPKPGTRRKKRITSVGAGWRAYLNHWSYVGGLFFAAVGVAGAWLATYVSSDTWGANMKADLPKLLTAAFAGAIGGTTIADLAGSFSQSGKDA